MNVSIIKQPYQVAFSQSEMYFGFAITPFGYNEQKQNITLNVSIEIEENFNSTAFIEIKQQSFYPDNSGKIIFDISSIIDPYLNYYNPRIDLPRITNAAGQYKRYRIAYQLQKNGITLGAKSYSDAAIAIKGGLSEDVLVKTDFFTNYIDANANALTYFKNFKVSIDETRFITALYSKDDGEAIKVKYTLYFDDNTSNDKTTLIEKTYSQWEVFVLPSGFNQCNLSTAIPAGKDISNVISYRVTVFQPNNANAVYLIKDYIIEHRNFYNTYQIFFRNSIGGFETLLLRGQVDFKTDYEKMYAKKTYSPESYANLLMLHQVKINNVDETISYKGNSGFISKFNLDVLRDIFIVQEVYELVENRFLPININTKSVNFYTNQDSLFNLQIDWSRAYVNHKYTPHNIIQYSTGCPNVETLVAVQKGTNKIQITYSLPLPYDLVEIFIETGMQTTESKFVTGNTGSIIFYVDPYLVTFPTNYTVKARVVCNELTIPKEVGAIKSVVVAMVQSPLPIANDDVYNIEKGFNSAIQLVGSVLANDYDQDDDSIEVVAVTGGSTNAGGTYDINASGIVSYTPSSSNFQGQDYFDYDIRKVGGITTVTARCYINVGNETTFVYAKMTTKRHSSSDIYDFYLQFFSNPQGTSPLDVTSKNITFNYQKVYTDFGAVNSHTENFSKIGAGIETFLFTSETIGFWTFSGTTYNFLSAKVLTGTGYGVI